MEFNRYRARRLAALVAALGMVTALSACGAGGSSNEPASGPSSVSTQVPTDENITIRWLTVNTGGQLETMKAVIQQWEKQHPNVTVEVENADSTTFNTNFKLIMSGDNPPDIIDANQATTAMVPLVKAGLLTPLTKYDELYGWSERINQSLLDQSRVTDDGNSWGTGTLYGVPWAANMIGLYYNRDKVKALGIDPTAFQSIADVTSAFEKANAAGETPLYFGMQDQNADGAEKPFEGLFAAFTKPEDKINFIRGVAGSSVKDNAEFIAASQQYIDWVKAGHTYEGAAGTTLMDGVGNFAKGKGVFMITGSWMMGTILEAGGDNMGFVLLPPMTAGDTPRASGATEKPGGISIKSKYPDVAASLLDFMSQPDRADTYLDGGVLPLTITLSTSSDKPLVEDEIKAWRTLTSDGLLTMHTAWTTTSMEINALNPGVQAMVLGQMTAEEFAAQVQAEWDSAYK